MKAKAIDLLKSRKFFYIMLFVFMLVRFFPADISYFKYMDDYNQYGVYSLLSKDLWNGVFLHYKLYAYRPLAGLLDAFVISRFYNCLWLVLIVMVLLHLLTIYMLDILLERINIPFGRVGALVFAFYPLLTEAAYWISASSRLVVSLFLAVLSVFLIDKFINGDKRKGLFLGLSLTTGILSQCFYEQTISFLFVFYYIYLFANRANIKQKFLYAVPALNLAIIGAYYYAFRNQGFLMNRMEGASGNIISTFVTGFKRVWALLYYEQRFTLLETAKWGISQLFSQYLPFALAAVLIACACAVFLLFQNTSEGKKGKYIWAGLFAIILFAAPFAPYALISTTYPYLRNIYISVIGIGILLACAWEFLTKIKAVKYVITSVTAFLLFFCIACQSMQVISYQTIEKYDGLIAGEIAQIIEAEPEHEKLWLFGAKYYYEPLIAPHFQNSIMSDWGLTGLLHVITKERRQPNSGIYANPVIPGQVYNIEIGKNDLLLGLDGTVPRILTLDDDKLYFSQTGKLFGTLTQGESGRFTPESNPVD